MKPLLNFESVLDICKKNSIFNDLLCNVWVGPEPSREVFVTREETEEKQEEKEDNTFQVFMT